MKSSLIPLVEKYRTILAIAMITTIYTTLLGINIIEYNALSYDIANGRTYILYSGLFSFQTALLLLMLGLALIFGSKDRVTFFMSIFLLYMFPIMLTLNFLLHGFVVGDQPRHEIALAYLLINGRATYDEALLQSGYFSWPGFWMLAGTFSGVTGLSPYEGPPLLMVVIYALLGLFLVIGTQALLVRNNKASKVFLVPLVAYTLLNPYKILHASPQIYALTLLLLITILMIKDFASRANISVFITTSIAIIISHPLTSMIIVGLTAIIIIFRVIRIIKSFEAPGIVTLTSAITIIIIFIAWNINYEWLIKSIVEEFTQPLRIQPLPPIVAISIYDIDWFYKAMSLYRYTALAILTLLTIIALLSMFKDRYDKTWLIFLILFGVGASSYLLTYIPGQFFHRVLYYGATLAIIISTYAVMRLKDLGDRYLPIFLQGIRVLIPIFLILLPLLSNISMWEFITNNNAVAIIVSIHENSANIFLAKHGILQQYSVGVSSPFSLPFYASLYGYSESIRMIHIPSQAATFIQTYREDLSISIEDMVRKVYIGDIFMTSPREKFIIYTNTLFNNFNKLEEFLNKNHNMIYTDNIYSLYIRFS